MEKLKLSKTELAALDLLISSIEEGDQKVKFGAGEDLAFITAVTRATNIVTKATKYVPAVLNVATYLIGGAIAAEKHISKILNHNGELDLETLKEIRKQVS